jgi:uncharacterized protein YjdB
MKRRLKSVLSLVTAMLLLLTMTAEASAAAGFIVQPSYLGASRYITAGTGSYGPAGEAAYYMTLATAPAADVTVTDYKGLVAAAAGLYVQRDTSFRIRVDGIGYNEANAILSDKRLWNDIFTYDIPGTTSDLDYLYFNMRGTMQVNGWLYGTYAVYEFSQSFYTTADQEATVDSAVRRILQELDIADSSQGSKVRAIHDYIVGSVEYDDTLNRFSAYNALQDQKTVCNGYTLLLYKLLVEAGVPVRAVSGQGVTGVKSENHAWNIVRIGAYWYNIDATWDDTARTTRYFLKSDAAFSDHIRSEEYDTSAFHAAHPMSPVDFDQTRDVTLVRSLSFASDGGTYPVGTQFTLPVSITPAGAASSLIWSSSNTGVAAVDGSGTVLVIGEGEAVITAASSDGSVSAAYRLTAVAADVPADWAKDAVTALSACGVVPEALQSGYRTSITRGEFTALLVNVCEHAMGPYTPVGTPPFADITGSPYEPQIAKGYDLGIINGMSEVSFEPDGTLTREQCAKIISITAGLINNSTVSSNAALPFGDTSAIQTWALPYVQYAYEYELMKGTGENFDPAGTLTRQEAMVIAERMLEKFGW